MPRAATVSTKVMLCFAAVLAPLALAAWSLAADEPAAAAAPAPATQPAAAATPAPQQPMGKGSWYLSTNTTPANWSKTGLYYGKPWVDGVDTLDNTTLELYVKAMTPQTIEVFNAKKLSIGMLAHPDETHKSLSAGVTLGNYVQLRDQNWTKVSIPLADFKDVNLHSVFFFPALPQALGAGEYALGVDEIRFVGGAKPVVFYGDEHPNNQIDIHGPGMKAELMPTGGVDLAAQPAGK